MDSSMSNDLQIYDPRQTDLSKRFNDAFLRFLIELPCKPAAANVNGSEHLQKKLPLFVVCHNHSRIASDVDVVLNELPEKGKLNYSMVCIVVFQSMEKHALQSIMPTDLLVGEDYQKYGLLVDIAFSKKIYDCNMNNIARAKIQRFLEQFIKQPSAIRKTKDEKSNQPQESDVAPVQERRRRSFWMNLLPKFGSKPKQENEETHSQIVTSNQRRTQSDEDKTDGTRKLLSYNKWSIRPWNERKDVMPKMSDASGGLELEEEMDHLIAKMNEYMGDLQKITQKVTQDVMPKMSDASGGLELEEEMDHLIAKMNEFMGDLQKITQKFTQVTEDLSTLRSKFKDELMSEKEPISKQKDEPGSELNYKHVSNIKSEHESETKDEHGSDSRDEPGTELKNEHESETIDKHGSYSRDEPGTELKNEHKSKTKDTHGSDTRIEPGPRLKKEHESEIKEKYGSDSRGEPGTEPKNEHESESKQHDCPGEENGQCVMLKFYKNEVTSAPNGFKIEDILKWSGDYSKLEEDHSYIQWLFPTKELSRYNRHVQPIEDHEAVEIRATPELYMRFMRAYTMMLDFYGMELKSEETGEVQRCQKNYKERFKHLNNSTHNFLRITRILIALGIFGFEHFQAPWLLLLMREVYTHKTLSDIPSDTIHRWIRSVKNVDDREEVTKSFKNMC